MTRGKAGASIPLLLRSMDAMLGMWAIGSWCNAEHNTQEAPRDPRSLPKESKNTKIREDPAKLVQISLMSR